MSVAVAPNMSPAVLQYISSLVLQKSAIVLEPSKAYLIESRLAPIARDNGLASLDQLVEKMRRPGSSQLIEEVVEAMTTNETSFYRDVHPFNAMRSDVIPAIMAARQKERTLNIWSNACSSGQEVYSIAMLLKESFPELAGWRVRLIATDLSKQILDKAQSGVFTQTEINRGLPMPMILKYFKRDGVKWQICDEIRRSVEFRVLNLIEPWPATLPKMDIVFLRNVLIYFNVDTKKQILDRVHKTLNPNGYLFLGGAETTMNLNVSFARQQIGAATCFKPT